MAVPPNGTTRRSCANRWTRLALAARTASEPERADPEHWSALAEEAQRVLDAEERLWTALAAGD